LGADAAIAHADNLSCTALLEAAIQGDSSYRLVRIGRVLQVFGADRTIADDSITPVHLDKVGRHRDQAYSYLCQLLDHTYHQVVERRLGRTISGLVGPTRILVNSICTGGHLVEGEADLAPVNHNKHI